MCPPSRSSFKRRSLSYTSPCGTSSRRGRSTRTLFIELIAASFGIGVTEISPSRGQQTVFSHYPQHLGGSVIVESTSRGRTGGGRTYLKAFGLEAAQIDDLRGPPLQHPRPCPAASMSAVVVATSNGGSPSRKAATKATKATEGIRMRCPRSLLSHMSHLVIRSGWVKCKNSVLHQARHAAAAQSNVWIQKRGPILGIRYHASVAPFF